jgi:excisionase family DNA binding protein
VSKDVAEQWLTVRQACALIGVSPATLRRWSDAGDLQAFTTPGGHRRFARSTILSRLPSGSRVRPNLERLGETPERMTRLYRRHLVAACRGMGWLTDLSDAELAELRDRGRDITESLLTHLDAADAAERQSAMAAAIDGARQCGRIAAVASAGIPATVELFLRFRRLFLGELVELTRRRGFDTTEATELLVEADRAFDALLTALLSGFQSQATMREAI